MPNIKTLLSVIDFTVNAVIYDIQNEFIFEHGCFKAISKQVIGFNTDLFFDKVILAYRLLNIQSKIGFIFSENVYRFLKTSLGFDAISELKHALSTRVGIEKADKILKNYNRITACHNYENYVKEERTACRQMMNCLDR